jgi:hypothetical protein
VGKKIQKKLQNTQNNVDNRVLIGYITSVRPIAINRQGAKKMKTTIYKDADRELIVEHGNMHVANKPAIWPVELHKERSNRYPQSIGRHLSRRDTTG